LALNLFLTGLRSPFSGIRHVVRSRTLLFASFFSTVQEELNPVMTNPSNFRYSASADNRVVSLEQAKVQRMQNVGPTAALETRDLDPSQDLSQMMARVVAEAADERKGEHIVVLKVDEVSYLADYFVIVSGFSPVQVRAIANAITQAVGEQCQREPLRVEGLAEGNWVLQDFGEVIVHILLPQEREFYNLEAFWGHGEQIVWDTLALTQDASL
jgi:ribosome-associated protein